MQNNKNILNSVAAVIHKNKCNKAGNCQKVVHSWNISRNWQHTGNTQS